MTEPSDGAGALASSVREGEQRLRHAARAGLAAGALVVLVVLLAGRAELFPWAPTGDFYDAQAHSFLDGRLDIDPDVMSIEGFRHDGRTYMYQPPFPALLRLPVVAITDELDGRLGAASMLLAIGVLAVAVEHLLVEIRRLLRPRAGPSRLEPALGSLLGFSALAGAAPVYLASRPWVYHEAALWGLAWTTATFAAVLRLRRSPGRAALAVLLLAAGGAVLSRPSVGLGALAAVGLLAVLVLWERRSAPTWGERLGGLAGPVALALVALLPLISYAAVNMAKFGSPTSVPFDQQVHSLIDPDRQAMLAENGGTLFGLQFAPTTLDRYLRPAGVDLTRTFPWVDFRPPGPSRVGGVQFDLVDRTASIPASMPALLAGALVGAVVIARRRDRAALVLGALLIGGLIGSATIIPFGYVAQRYLADVAPLLLLGSAVALHALSASSLRPVARRGALAATALAVAGGAWINVALALQYQRLHAPNPRPDLVAGFVELQTQVGERLGRPPQVLGVDALPEAGADGVLVSVRDCEALYAWSRGWVAVERTGAAGQHRFDLDIAGLEEGRRYPLVATRDPAGPLLWIERRGAHVVGGADDGPGERPQPIRGRDDLVVVLDPHLGASVAWLGDQPLASGSVDLPLPLPDLLVGAAPGRDGVEPTTPGLTERPGEDDGALCQRLMGS